PEHDRHVASDEIEDVKSVQLRHLHVEKQQIRLEFANDFDSLEAVDALGDDLDPGFGGQILSQRHPRRLLIVDDDHTQRSGRVVHAAGPPRGTDNETRSASGAASIESDARSPNAAARRLRTMSRPSPVPFRMASASRGFETTITAWSPARLAAISIDPPS